MNWKHQRGGMDGWRIVVDERLQDSRHLRVDRPGDISHEMAAAQRFVLTPARVPEAAMAWDAMVSACFDPLFETIYVSRAVTDEEADTLRRLLHEEEMRRREAERQRDTISVHKSRALGPTMPPAECVEVDGIHATMEQEGRAMLELAERVAEGLKVWRAVDMR